MRILITGDRDYTDGRLIGEILEKYQAEGYDTIIEGEARGADKLSRIEAERLGMQVIPIPAQWIKYGKKAGPLRNMEMLEYKPNLVIAFHDDLQNSKGTKHMIRIAKEAGLPVKLIQHE